MNTRVNLLVGALLLVLPGCDAMGGPEGSIRPEGPAPDLDFVPTAELGPAVATFTVAEPPMFDGEGRHIAQRWDHRDDAGYRIATREGHQVQHRLFDGDGLDSRLTIGGAAVDAGYGVWGVMIDSQLRTWATLNARSDAEKWAAGYAVYDQQGELLFMIENVDGAFILDAFDDRVLLLTSSDPLTVEERRFSVLR